LVYNGPDTLDKEDKSMFGMLGKFLGMWRRPSQETKEVYDIESQWRVPRNKIWGGVFTSTLALLLAWFILSLTVKPSHFAEGITYFGGFALVVSAAITWNLRIDPMRSAVYASMIALGVLGITIAWVSQSHQETWIFAKLHWIALDLVRIFGVALATAGGFGAYWFAKELINPFELTGFDRVLASIVEVLKEHIPDIIQAELGAMGIEDVSEGELQDLQQDILGTVKAGIDAARKSATVPIDGQKAVAAHESIHFRYTMDVFGFLFCALMWGDMLSRNKWVDEPGVEQRYRLPSGLEVDYRLHGAIIDSLVKIGVIDPEGGPKGGPSWDLGMDVLAAMERISLLTLEDPVLQRRYKR
jgi:hypothetical protein